MFGPAAKRRFVCILCAHEIQLDARELEVVTWTCAGCRMEMHGRPTTDQLGLSGPAMWFADLLGWGSAVEQNLLMHIHAAVRSSLSAAAQTEVTGAAAKDLALRTVAQWVATLAQPSVPRHPTSDAWIAALAEGGDGALLQHFRRVELQDRDLVEVVFAASPEPLSHPRFQFDFTTDREGRARLTTCYTVWRHLPGDS